MPNWLSTHPEPAERVVEAAAAGRQAGEFDGDAIERNRDGYLEHIDGIVVGDNPKDGIVRGNAFLHPALRFALEFPEGWEVMNTPDAGGRARARADSTTCCCSMVDQPRGRTPEEIAHATR